MAQAVGNVGTRRVDRGAHDGRATALFKALREPLLNAYSTSRERERLGRAMSTARVGRETGVKC